MIQTLPPGSHAWAGARRPHRRPSRVSLGIAMTERLAMIPDFSLGDSFGRHAGTEEARS